VEYNLTKLKRTELGSELQMDEEAAERSDASWPSLKLGRMMNTRRRST
jgi:hypothetical protein